MNTQQLKEYLGIVVDMEKNIFMQEHAIDQLNWKASRSSWGFPIISPNRPLR